MKPIENQINELSYAEQHTLLYLLTKLGGTGNTVKNITQKQIADNAGVTPSCVCQAISYLEEEGFITVIDKTQPRTYEIDAELATQRDIVMEALQVSIEEARKQSHNGDIELIRANIQKIVSRVKAGESYKSIAEDYNVNNGLLGKMCRELGIRSKYSSPYENSEHTKMEANMLNIIEVYENGSTLEQLANHYSVSVETIRQYLKEWNVDTSPAARKARLVRAE